MTRPLQVWCVLQARHEHGGRSLGHAMGARKRAGGGKKRAPPQLEEQQFMSTRTVVMCRAESFARELMPGPTDVCRSLCIIAAAPTLYCGVGGVQNTSYRRRLRACLLARLSCLSLPCVAPFGASYNRGYLGLGVAR